MRQPVAQQPVTTISVHIRVFNLNLTANQFFSVAAVRVTKRKHSERHNSASRKASCSVVPPVKRKLLLRNNCCIRFIYRPASKHDFLCSIARPPPPLLSIFQDISRGVRASCVNTPSDDQQSGFVAFLSSQCAIF